MALRFKDSALLRSAQSARLACPELAEGKHAEAAALFLDHPARGRIALSGGFAVTPETRSCSSFADRRQSQSLKIRRQTRLPARLAHDWVRFVIRRISRHLQPIRGPLHLRDRCRGTACLS